MQLIVVLIYCQICRHLSTTIKATLYKMWLLKNSAEQQYNLQQPRYRREDRAMPLYISIGINFYNGIARFLCHSTALLYSPTLVTVQMLKLRTVRWFSRP